MFRELIKLREIERLLRTKHYRELLILTKDPSIRDHLRAVKARDRALAALQSEAAALEGEGRAREALRAVRDLLKEREDEALRLTERRLALAVKDADDQARELAHKVDHARRLASRGDVAGAVQSLKPLVELSPEARAIAGTLAEQQAKAKALAEEAESQLRAGQLEQARDALRRAHSADPHLASLPELRKRLATLALKSNHLHSLLGVLADTSSRGPVGAEDVSLRENLASAALEVIESALRRGELDSAGEALQTFVNLVPEHAQARAYASGLRKLSRAVSSHAAGEVALSAELLAAAAEVLPSIAKIKELRAALSDSDKASFGPLKGAREAMGRGEFVRARELLLSVLEREPKHRDARQLLEVLDREEAEDSEALRKARDLLTLGVEGSLDDCRKLLLGLESRRPDLVEVPVLVRDVDRRIRDARLRAFEAESVLFSRRGCAEVPKAARSSSPDLPPRVGGEIEAGRPFILRVEEHGEWFVHPGPSLILGNSTKGRADLPVMAAIGAQHLRIERRASAGSGFEYVVTPEPQRKVLRNRKILEGTAVLQHGDLLSLGDVVAVTFLRPLPSNGTATLRFDGNFGVAGCRQVVLFSETGRDGAVILGPGPESHVPFTKDAARVEIFRQQTPAASELVARSPLGVSVDGAGERPQVRLKSGVDLRAGEVGFFLDPQ